LVPGSLVGDWGEGVASAQTTSTPGVPTILAGPEFPIGLWGPPPPEQTTTQRYKEIADAGFNFVIGGNGVHTNTTNQTALNVAKANSLRFLLWDGQLVSLIRDKATQTAVSDRIKQILQRFPVSTYPARAGLVLRDEPNTTYFPILGYANGVLQGLDSKQLPWINLYGYTTDPGLTGVSNYEEYLRLYLDQVKPPFLSFDHYPLVSDFPTITARHFENWALIRKYSLQAGIPPWGFIQSVDFKWTDNRYPPRRRPNEAELFWQVNVSLAYGAKGLQYFTYWTPKSNTTVTFGEALVTTGGNLTPLYSYAKRVNTYLKAVGKVLLPLKSVSVVHAGESTLPPGTTAFPTQGDGYISSVSGSPVILGSFTTPAGGTERYLLVVNRSFSASLATGTKLTLDASVRTVSELNSTTGTFTQVTLREPEHSLPLSIDRGKARLYMLRK
jgi:hypothetical protein